ncbi:MAG TPA: flippase activity-associated protein Agl23 [Blastocatellia bacterium]|nr:flippase activity-associated protein Agl23 [Blastocatellia bacterium]
MSTITKEERRSHPFGPRTAWLVASSCVLAISAILRLYDLGLNPLHQDEGVNAFFSLRLYNEGFYQYDPTNYHGPTLYYFALAALRLFGLSTFAIRLAPALFGVATVWLVLCLRRHAGTVGALAGAALVAVSPGAVYMSRYFIHESLFVFFTLAVVVAALRYLDTGRIVYLMLASLAAALAFATKETVIISASVLILAFFLTPLLIDIRRGSVSKEGPSEWEKNMRGYLKWLIAAGLFVFVSGLFYSSFFSNERWAKDVLISFQYWARTGRSGHDHSWYTYISWLMKEELFVLALGLAGAGLILWRASNRFLIFILLWFCGLLFAYSFIPYKTPWLTLNLIIPLAIIGGHALDAVGRRAKNSKQRALAAGAVGIIICATLYETIRLNYLEYDDNSHPYVYAHTHRDFLSLTNEVSKLANNSAAGLDTAITITSSEYWPLPWYLRDYKQVAYLEQVRGLTGTIVIGSEDQESELRAALGDRYERIGSYVLRPGYNLILYALRDKDDLQ